MTEGKQGDASTHPPQERNSVPDGQAAAETAEPASVGGPGRLPHVQPESGHEPATTTQGQRQHVPNMQQYRRQLPHSQHSTIVPQYQGANFSMFALICSRLQR